MKGTDQFRAFQNVFQLSRDCPCGSRIAVLVVHHFERAVSVLRQFQDRMDKTWSSGAVQPRQPADDVVGAMVPDQFLPREFAFAVNRMGMAGGVEFMIRPVQFSVKDVVRRNGNEPRPVAETGRGDVCLTEGVDSICQIAFRLATIHGSHRCTMNDRIGSRRRHQPVKVGGMGDVRFGKIGEDRCRNR